MKLVFIIPFTLQYRDGLVILHGLTKCGVLILFTIFRDKNRYKFYLYLYFKKKKGKLKYIDVTCKPYT